MKTYKANWDRTVKGLTIFVVLLIIGSTLFVAFAMLRENSVVSKSIMPWLGVILAFASIGVAYLLRPLRYEVYASKINIVRPLGEIVIHKKDIQRIQTVDKSAMGRSIR